jgi:ketosteroid isomerase-like protein
MRKSVTAAAAAFLAMTATPALAGPAEDATAAITSTLDKFNSGDIDAFFAAHQDGALIVDEFAPYVWGGPKSAERWAGDYMKDAGSRGVTGGRIVYGKPLQAASDGTSAYVVLPTTYRFEQGGKAMAGKGSMTFVMHKSGTTWKIASWTYSGSQPTAE